jgi:hypothetical protein
MKLHGAIVRAVGLLGLAAMLSLVLAASASATNQATSIESVAFHGSAAAPEVVVTGKEFGAAPPKAGKAGCKTTGSGYGKLGGKTGVGVINDNGPWVAGFGKACIGLIINSWSETKIVFHFGSGYASYQNLNSGYHFVLQIEGAFYGGIVSYT